MPPLPRADPGARALQDRGATPLDAVPPAASAATLAGVFDPLLSVRRWAASGAMALTGFRDGPPLLPPARFADAAVGAVAELRAFATPGHRGTAKLDGLDGPALLGEKAAAASLTRRGAVAPGGSCRLISTSDGWIAVNLAREDDHSLLSAWLEAKPPLALEGREDPSSRTGTGDGGGGGGGGARARAPARPAAHPAAHRQDEDGEEPVWRWLRAVGRARSGEALVARGRELGLAVAVAAAPPSEPCPWLRSTLLGTRIERSADARPRVLDLSALWAGPLCGQLLWLAGAEVIKVESTRRPDGARRGPALLHDALNSGKASVALDFHAAEDRRLLRALVADADIVIEGSRPRALRQLGIEAEAIVGARPGCTWLSITGHGRDEPRAQWVAFGDDAAVAAGCAEAMRRRHGVPLFVGDAIADPLAGLHGAVAALQSFRAGGGELLDVSLYGVAAALLAEGFRPPPCEVRRAPSRRPPATHAADAAAPDSDSDSDSDGDAGEWSIHLGGPGGSRRQRDEPERIPVEAPRIRRAVEAARALGADTRRVVAGLARPC